MAAFVTGDTHSKDFKDLCGWANRMGLTMDDTIIVLGDHGINFYLSWKDRDVKKKIQRDCPCNIFVIRGNHDRRPEDVYRAPWHGDTYAGDYPRPKGEIDTWFEGRVWVEPTYPKIKHAIDGEIYTIDSMKCLVIGGGYSVDKYYRLENGWTWIPNEQLNDAEMKTIFQTFKNNKVDVILSHVAPKIFHPWIQHTFMGGIDAPIEDDMERWMDKLYWNEIQDIKIHYFGHYHVNLNTGLAGVALYDIVIPFGERCPKEIGIEHYRQE